jgi:hypothetical protein
MVSAALMEPPRQQLVQCRASRFVLARRDVEHLRSIRSSLDIPGGSEVGNELVALFNRPFRRGIPPVNST